MPWIRTFKHSDLEEYAKWSDKPVIKALLIRTPMSSSADYLIIKEELTFII